MTQIVDPREIYYVCCWRDDAGRLHPNPLTVATTTNRCSTLANDLLGVRTAAQRRRRGFEIHPFRIQLNPAWTEDEEPDNVIPLREA